MTTTMASKWSSRRADIFRSVFQTDISQPTPYATPLAPFPQQGQPFGGPLAPPAAPAASNLGGGGGPRPPGASFLGVRPGAATSSTGGASSQGHGQAYGQGQGQGQAPRVPPFSSSPTLPSSSPLRPADAGEDQVRWDRAWHVVTSRIQLPQSVAVEDSFGTLAPSSQDGAVTAAAAASLVGGLASFSFAQPPPPPQASNADFYDALRLVLRPATELPRASHVEDLVGWHTQQVRRHMAQHVLPLLSACEAATEPEDVLLGCVHTLEAAHRQYLYGLSLIVRGMDDPKESEAALARFWRELHAVTGSSMSKTMLKAVETVFGKRMRIILGITSSSDEQTMKGKRGTRPGDWEARVTRARQELLELVASLDKVGLTGEAFQVTFAGMMDQMMREKVKMSYVGAWSRPSTSGKRAGSQQQYQTAPPSTWKAGAPLSPCISDLCEWVENHFARLAVEVFARIDGQTTIAWSDVETWKEIGIGRLTALRIDELFSIVLEWPKSKPALDDLRAAVTTPQRRLQLTDAFSDAVQKQLLHPGRSTLDILQVYISMIRVFHYLDHSKVLLDRVAQPLQLYLCQRDDAVRIVVSGLLSSPDDKNAEPTGERDGEGSLSELAMLLNDSSQQRRQQQQQTELADDEPDWNDMEWMPAPIDAGVNYKRPKSEDVIGTLIGALGSQDVFIKEFQSMVAERLLSSHRREFVQEVKVLNLLRRRFGESAVQNCDVMIKDIQDSKKVDFVILRNMKWPTSREAQEGSADKGPRVYHTKILSRLFWPNLSKEHFIVPKPVADVQAQYAHEYEQLKSHRKLAWMDHLGRAAVHLQLDDRTIDVECKTYEAAVIYAFQDDGGQGGLEAEQATTPPARRTFMELYEKLQLDEDLLEASLRFWVDKRVLRQVEEGVFVVLESLEGGGDSASAARSGTEEWSAAGGEGAGDGGLAGGTPSPRKLPAGSGPGLSSEERKRGEMYWRYIVGMLTNSSPAMPLSQMAMMMKMLIADGFPWSNEELQEFLAEKIAAGEMELVGGKYRLPKK